MLLRPHFSLALLTGGLVFLALPQCQPALEPDQTERFELVAGPAAAEGYPMEIEEGRFTTSDGQSIPFGAEFLEGDWGLSHSVVVSGDGTAPAPDSLAMRWFSYPEDKFYEGRWPMPQRRIHALLQQGYWDTNEHQHGTYSELTVCLLPKGVVVVWLCGRNQVLLGRYQARAISFDFKRFNAAANRPRMIAQEQAKLPPAVQAQIRSGTLSTRRWEEYLRAYRWRLAFSPPLRLVDYGLSYFNAESDNYPRTASQALARATALGTVRRRPAPSNLLLRVEVGSGRTRQLQAKALDEVQTLAAFRTLSAAHPAAPLTLCVETNARGSQARLVLKNDWQQVVLSKSPVLIYADE